MAATGNSDVISSFLPALQFFWKKNYLHNVSPKVLRQIGNVWEEEERWTKDSFPVKFGDGGESRAISWNSK